MSSNIEFVYFDLGNVLVSFDPNRACQNLATLTGRSIEEVNQALYESGVEVRYELGELTNTQFSDELRSNLGLSAGEVSDQELLDAMANMFDPIDSMVEVVKLAREQAGRVGVLSNTCPAHWDWVRRQPWPVAMIDFDVRVLSFESKSMKPDSKIYSDAESAAGVPAERILFVDDKIENVDAATARGWKAAQCVGGEEATKAINRFLGA